MKRSVVSSAGAVVFFLGLASGWLAFRGPPEPVESAEAASERARLTVENADLRAEIERIRAASRAGVERLEDLRARLAEAEAAAAAAKEEGEAEPPPAAPPPRAEPGLPYTLASVDEADAILAQALADADPQALWELAAVLLSMGEEGYEKVLALLQRLSEEAKDHELLGTWLDDELMAGRFFRAVVDSQDDVLRFLLYLQTKDPATLPREIASIQKELLDDGGAVILGFYDGEDPQILDGFVPLYARSLEQDQGRSRHHAMRSLAQIRSDAATDALLGALETAEGRDVIQLVLALGYQANPRALPHLQALRGVPNENPHFPAILESAIRRFGR